MTSQPPAGYRQLSFATFSELSHEVDRLEAAQANGDIVTHGNWSAGQIFEHVGRFIRFTYDGFPFKAPWYVALMGRAMKPFLGKMKLKPGSFTLPPDVAEHLVPDDSVTFEQGLSTLRQQIARVENGERMEQPSPLFGKLGHERWTRMHLDHAAMHMGFIAAGE